MPPEVPTTPLPSTEDKEEVENVNTVEVALPCLPPKPARERCKVLYPYEAQNEDELSLKEEDIVILLSRDAPDKGWWRGELNGRSGLFPDNFVTVLPSTEEPSSKSDKPSSCNKTTTNRARDSITKPGEATTAALRKSLDLSNKKEVEIKSSPVQVTPPAAPKQKPAPPIKKPSRSPPSKITPPVQVTSGGSITPTSPNLNKHNMKFSLPIPPPPVDVISTGPVLSVSDNNNKTQISIPSSPTGHSDISGDAHDGSCLSRTSGSYSVTNVNCNSSAIVNNQHDSIQSNSITTRRGSTSGGAADNERRTSGGTTNSLGVTATHSSDSELEERPVSGAKLTHLTANRARAPRRRPPSAIISKEDSQQLSTMMNGSAESHAVEKIISKISPTPAVPWVEELKMNQAKKNSAQGKTRVTIGPFNSTTTSSNPSGATTVVETPPSSKTATGATVGVMFRTQRPASMFASEPPSQPTTGAALVRNNSTATCNKPNMGPSSVSPVPSGAPVKPPLTSAISPNTKPPQHPPPGDHVISITQKQWSDLLDKISKLESVIESQSTLINDLNKKVKSGQDKQTAMQNEMDKLMDLVTQV